MTASTTTGTALPDLASLEVWFVVGSQELYGPETLAQVAEQSKRLAAELDASPDVPVKIVLKPTLVSSDAVAATLAAANDAPNVIGVIAWMHTFSPAKTWIRGLNALRKPLLHWHTQVEEGIPYSTIDFDYMNLNQSAHGDREFGYILTRLGVVRKTVVGHVRDPRVTRRIGTWTRAAAGWHEWQGMRIGRIGDNMRYVAVTEGDKTAAESSFGFSVNTWASTEVAALVAQVSDADAEALAAVYDDTYEVATDLRAGGDRRASVVEAARIELGLRAFLSEGGFHAFTDTCEDLAGLRQLPGVAVQRRMADGYGFGPEGDWKTPALLRAFKVMGTGLPGGASLMEDYTYELRGGWQEGGDEAILGAHMLEVCPTLTTKKPSLEVHPLGIDVVALPEPLPKLPVARALWHPRPDFRTATEAWLEAGGAHHTAFTSQLDLEAVEDFARIAGAELVKIA